MRSLEDPSGLGPAPQEGGEGMAPQEGGEGVAVLPTELLAQVFAMVGRSHLPAVVAVCRRWRGGGEAPRLWRGLTLRVEGWRGRWEEALASRRLQAITSCHLREVTSSLLEAVASHPTLTSLTIAYPAQLAPLAPALLASTLGAMEEVTIQGAFLPSLHSRQLMAAIGQSTTNIRRLHLAIDLSAAGGGWRGW